MFKHWSRFLQMNSSSMTILNFQTYFTQNRKTALLIQLCIKEKTFQCKLHFNHILFNISTPKYLKFHRSAVSSQMRSSESSALWIAKTAMFIYFLAYVPGVPGCIKESRPNNFTPSTSFHPHITHTPQGYYYS